MSFSNSPYSINPRSTKYLGGNNEDDNSLGTTIFYIVVIIVCLFIILVIVDRYRCLGVFKNKEGSTINVSRTLEGKYKIVFKHVNDTIPKETIFDSKISNTINLLDGNKKVLCFSTLFTNSNWVRYDENGKVVDTYVKV